MLLSLYYQPCLWASVVLFEATQLLLIMASLLISTVYVISIV